MFRVGPLELMIVLVIVLVIFGAKRLPEIGSGLGKGILNFKRAFQNPESLEEGSSEDEDTKKSKTT